MLSMHRVVCRVGKELALGTRFQIDALIFWLVRRICGQEFARVGHESNGIPWENAVLPCQIHEAFPGSFCAA